MTWINKIRLNKQLLRSVAGAGYDAPKEVQLKTLPRIFGGQDVIAVAPEGGGKTTAYIIAVLNRFNYAPDGVPKVLVLTPDKEGVETVTDRFNSLNKNKAIAIVGLYALPGMEAQMEALADGADIVVATPDRARAIYLKLGLNLNKIELLVIDDAEVMIKHGLQLPVIELANSITKAQHLVFTTVIHDKLNKMIAPFMKQPAVVEVEETGETTLNLHPQALYQVPNFGTKLNLLDVFMQDDELFNKVVVFVNTRHTAEKVYKSLHNTSKKVVAIYKSWVHGLDSFNNADDFIADEQVRILILANETEDRMDLTGMPFLLHFDLPRDKGTFIERVINNSGNTNDETLAITFATDLELDMVKKITQASGQKIPVMELPEGLVIKKDKNDNDAEENPISKAKISEPVTGAAFHEKKASNSKTYNYSSGTKAKMNKKKKHG